MKIQRIVLIAVAIVSCLALVACSSNPKPKAEPVVLSVAAGASIQEVLDAAEPGDVVLVEPGTYTGELVIGTENITLRGKDRNSVIVDGKYTQEVGINIAANGVVVENLTVQAFTKDAISIHGGYKDPRPAKITGPKTIARYGVAYVNAMNNGEHGISISSSQNGTITETFTRANAGSGIYLDSCDPCNSNINNNVAEQNGIGIHVVNASNDIYIHDNNFSENRAGIRIETDSEASRSPQNSSAIFSNIVDSNNAENAPTLTPDIFGLGITVAGGTNNTIHMNQVNSNSQAGLALLDNNGFISTGNTFESNNVRNNGIPVGFDIAFIITGQKTVDSSSNCFAKNSYSSSSVDKIEQVMSCPGKAAGPFPSQKWPIFTIPDAPDYMSVAIEAQTQKNMPGKITDIPGKLGNIVKPDVSKASLPDA